MKKVGVFFLFLILGGQLSVSHCWEWRSLCIFHKCPLSFDLEEVTFPSWFVEWFYHEELLDFVKCFLWMSWDDCIVFPSFWSCALLNWLIHWAIFAFLRWISLLMVHDPLNVLLDLACYCCVEDLGIYNHQGHWSAVFLWWLCLALLARWCWSPRINELGCVPSSSIFWKEFEKDCC